ncbi:phosphate carrier protein, mitochondrial-like [Acanthaster planci]|uniref:Phosphate carrier protein, mitochondrial-like n=1 Tax=Acanthaster planci TaxID=133434 RepID=A0A8B7ZNG6_ACAPL|nr:phosphate carrier protein, mitochondrial-like [Acanthaster planci]
MFFGNPRDRNRIKMFSALFDTVKRNHFSSPFITTARCEGDGAPTLPSENLSQNLPTTITTPKLASVDEETSCEFGTAKYYAICGFGGILSCGITHTAVVPLDLVKCRIQVDPVKYVGIFNGFKVTVREEGVRALAKGWAPTAIGYSMQGLCKFGFYEVFKALYSKLLGEEKTYLYRTSLYLAASASAEFFADIALAPMEAVKVRVQTQPGFASTLREGVPKLWAMEGIRGFYKGLPPLWLRQIPYTMMKFACFERTVEFLYKYVVPKPRSECSKPEQLVITFLAGYIAGVFCAVVSHPADTVVSKLNQDKGSTPLDAARKLGMAGLWKGLFPRIIMIGTLTALQWFIYDSVKVYFKLPRPPPPEMPESLKRKLAAKEGN